MNEEIQPVKSKLQVWHYAQIPCEPFCVDVKDEFEASKVAKLLADQHLFLWDQNIIPDYANTIQVMMYDENQKEWINYYNDHHECEWDDFESDYLSFISKTENQDK